MEDEIKMNEQRFIKDVIYENRKKKGMTQEQLADILNVSNKTISKWERGIGYPDMTLIPTLAKALDINISDLFNVKEASTQKQEGEEVYNTEVIIKFKIEMFIAIVLLVLSLLIPTLFILLLHERVLVNLGYVLGILLSLASATCASITSYRFYCFFNTKVYKKNYMVEFIKHFFSYWLAIYIILAFLFLVIFKGHINMIMRVLLYLIFLLPIILFSKKLNLKLHNNRINIILMIISVILFVTACTLTLLNNYVKYILIFIASQVINYTIIFLQTKVIGTKGESN